MLRRAWSHLGHAAEQLVNLQPEQRDEGLLAGVGQVRGPARAADPEHPVLVDPDDGADRRPFGRFEAGKSLLEVGGAEALLGLLTGLDRNMLAAYCQAHALWAEAVSSIERYGTMVKSPNGYPMQSPYVAVANKQVDIMVRIAAEFGMTPSSRTRIRVGERPPEDPFEAFLERRGG